MTARRGYALLALAAAAFVVYGSLVPFRFKARPAGDAWAAFGRCLVERAWPESRSDGLGNVLVAVPLGFGLVGALRAGRTGTAGTLVACGLAVAAATLLALLVEFGQLFVPGRTCAGSDVLAQALGGAVGAAGWLVLGGWVTRLAWRAADHPRAGGRAGKVLAVYLVAVLGVQLLPLDLDPSPAGLYRKLRDGKAALLSLPDHSAPGKGLGQVLTLLGLFLPAGLLAARVPDWPGGLVVAGGTAFALLTEAGQLLVSRHASLSDGLIGGLGVGVGLAVGRGRLPLPPAAWGVIWLAVLAVIWWAPFDFTAAAGSVNWLPLADLQQADYLHDADVMATRAVLFVPLGAAAGAAGAGRLGWLLAAAAAAGLEAGQVFLPGRTPSTTDVALAAVGGWAGAVGRRLAGSGGGAGLRPAETQGRPESCPTEEQMAGGGP